MLNLFKTAPDFFLKGIAIYGKANKGKIQKDLLRVTELAFLNQVIFPGKLIYAFDSQASRYSKISYRLFQMQTIFRSMRDCGIESNNLEMIYDRSMFPEFAIDHSVVRSKKKVSVIFKKRDMPEKTIETEFGKIVFDCFLDVFLDYGKHGPNCSMRICRMKFNDGATQLYVEAHNKEDRKLTPSLFSRKFNYWQETGAKLYAEFLAIQFALLHKPGALQVKEGQKVREARFYVSGAQPEVRPVFDYDLEISNLTDDLVPCDNKPWHLVRKKVAKKKDFPSLKEVAFKVASV